jgi:hypothetical protein
MIYCDSKIERISDSHKEKCEAHRCEAQAQFNLTYQGAPLYEGSRICEKHQENMISCYFTLLALEGKTAKLKSFKNTLEQLIAGLEKREVKVPMKALPIEKEKLFKCDIPGCDYAGSLKMNLVIHKRKKHGLTE